MRAVSQRVDDAAFYLDHCRSRMQITGLRACAFMRPIRLPVMVLFYNPLSADDVYQAMSSSSVASRVAPNRSAARIIVATIVGNGFAAYDFTVYSFYAAIIGKLYFPAGDPSVSMLLSLATFGAGFVVRPLGAVVIGHIADVYGRRTGMTVSLSLATVGTWLIACLPTHASIGIAATVLMVVARLVQGFAAGGEIGPASAVLMEMANRDRRCYMASWRGASQGAAACAAALIGATLTATLSPHALTQWGWRVPFMLGGLIGPVGWYLRRHMPAHRRPASTSRPPLSGMMRRHPRALIFGTMMMAAPSVSIYLTVFYMPHYLVDTLHRPAAISLLTASLSGLVIFAATPLVARMADRQASRKPIQAYLMVACLLLTWPLFVGLHQFGTTAALLMILAYDALALSNAGASSVLMMEAFDVTHRAAGLSIIYAVGVTVFGGFSPLAVASLMHRTHDPMTPAWYLMAAIVVSLIGLAGFPATSVRRLSADAQGPAS